MKAFKLKKRTERIPIYFSEEPISFFKKPAIPFSFIKKINRPNLYEKNIQYQIISESASIPDYLRNSLINLENSES